MAIDEIPVVQNSAYYQIEVELDGVIYRMDFFYNSRDDSWYLTIYDSEENVLRAGIRVVTSWDLLRTWAGVGRPGGKIISIPSGKVSAPPTLEQLGVDVILAYFDEAEVLSIG